MHDKLRFKQAFNRLAVATRLPADQADAPMQKIYFDGLEAFPIDAVEAAAQTLAEHGQWFPKLAEWREAADKAKTARVLARALPDPGRTWHDECGVCQDTGWEILHCDGPDGPNQCRRCQERKRSFYAHEYAVACTCRATNHTYQRRQAEQHARAAGRAW